MSYYGQSSSYNTGYGQSTGGASLNHNSSNPPQQPGTGFHPPPVGAASSSANTANAPSAATAGHPSYGGAPIGGAGYMYGSQPQQQSQASGMSSWTQPQQQQQNAAATGMNAFFDPTTAATLATAAATGNINQDAMFDLASTTGKAFLASGTARMIPGLELFMQTLRTYFAVDNRYVQRKIYKVLLPFLHKQWARQGVPEGPEMTMRYALPHTDENAPDLYLPSMSLISYVLLCAICYGTAGKFDPEVLPDVTTKCFGTQLLEVALIRFGFYMMQAPVAILDLFSYTGYKYVGLCLNMVVGLLLGHFGVGRRGYYLFFLWTASAASYFVLKTMSNAIPMHVAAAGPKREVMVFAFALSQFATMWFVSQTSLLDTTTTPGSATVTA